MLWGYHVLLSYTFIIYSYKYIFIYMYLIAYFSKPNKKKCTNFIKSIAKRELLEYIYDCWGNNAPTDNNLNKGLIYYELQ